MMRMKESELKGFYEDQSGKWQYIPLYPLLESFWSEPLEKMPAELRLRVKYAVSSWDALDNLDRIARAPAQLTIRQKRIRTYDIECDVTQEWETYEALNKYITEGNLHDRIEEAISNVKVPVADALRDDVALPLKKILSEVGIHWPDPKPLLWNALCQFSKIELPSLIEKAKGENNDYLVAELGYVSTEIYKILNVQRYHVGKEIELEWEANALAQASSVVALKLEGGSRVNPKPKQVRENDRQGVVNIESERKTKALERLAPVGVKLDTVATEMRVPRRNFDALAAEYDSMLCENPSLTATQLMMRLLARIGEPDTCILVNIGDGLKWEAFNGKPPKILTIKKLDDRISRWKKKNKTRS